MLTIGASQGLQAAEDDSSIVYFQEPFGEPGASPGSLPQDWEILLGEPDHVTLAENEGGTYLQFNDASKTGDVAMGSRFYLAERGDEFTVSARIGTGHEENPAVFLVFVDKYGQDLESWPVMAAAEKGEDLSTWAQIELTKDAPKYAAAVRVVLYSYPLPKGLFGFDDIILKGPARGGLLAWEGPREAPAEPRKLKKDEVPSQPYEAQ